MHFYFKQSNFYGVSIMMQNIFDGYHLLSCWGLLFPNYCSMLVFHHFWEARHICHIWVFKYHIHLFVYCCNVLTGDRLMSYFINPILSFPFNKCIWVGSHSMKTYLQAADHLHITYLVYAKEILCGQLCIFRYVWWSVARKYVFIEYDPAQIHLYMDR